MSRINFQSDCSGEFGGGGAPSEKEQDSNSVAPVGRLVKGKRWQLGVKRLVDIVGVLFIFAVLSLPYLLIALCVLVTMGRPVHYWQIRIGKNGAPFRFYKFRSMVKNSSVTLDQFLEKNESARKEWIEFQKLRHDPRITPFGRFIRRFGIDELPQLLNVLRGEMSLVGPRPCLQRQRTLYKAGWPHYCAMRPGITGLWQVSGRNRLPYSKRVELDVNYVNNWSLWLDLKILLGTFKVVIRGDGC